MLLICARLDPSRSMSIVEPPVALVQHEHRAIDADSQLDHGGEDRCRACLVDDAGQYEQGDDGEKMMPAMPGMSGSKRSQRG